MAQDKCPASNKATVTVTFQTPDSPEASSSSAPFTANIPLHTPLRDIPSFWKQTKGSKHFDAVKLPGQALPLPTTWDELRELRVVVTRGPSVYDRFSDQLCINENQSLIHFYNKACIPPAPMNVELNEGAAIAKPASTSTRRAMHEISVNGGKLGIAFKRTIRVPDDARTHNLPPGLGAFPLFNTSEYEETLPRHTVEKRGLFFPMYQREAMWIDFEPKGDYENKHSTGRFAIRIYAGGVNVVTGEPNTATLSKRENGIAKKQDYIVFPPQLWVDGIATGDGKVKQFVAVPSGSGYSIEHQITGVEAAGGIQFEIIPCYEDTVDFFKDGAAVSNRYGTPLELGMEAGQSFVMRDNASRRSCGPDVTLGDLIQDRAMHLARHPLVLVPAFKFDGILEVFVKGTDAGVTLLINTDSSQTFEEVEQRLTFRTETGRTLWSGTIIIRSWDDLAKYVRDVFVRSGRHQTNVKLTWEKTMLVYIRNLTGGTDMPLKCKPTTRVCKLLCAMADRLNTSMEDYRLFFDGERLSNNDTLEALNISNGDRLECRESLVGGGCLSYEMALGAGGTIKQSIMEDTTHARHWDTSRAKLLNVAIVNSVRFEEITGCVAPPTPIDIATYARQGLPFFDLYQEPVTGVGGGGFENVKTVGEIDAVAGVEQYAVYNPESLAICPYCVRKMQECVVRPCNHCVCKACAKRNTRYCPVCGDAVERIVWIAGPMGAPGHDASKSEPPVVLLDIVDGREMFRSIRA